MHASHRGLSACMRSIVGGAHRRVQLNGAAAAEGLQLVLVEIVVALCAASEEEVARPELLLLIFTR